MNASFRTFQEGAIVKGRILEIKPQIVLVDIGYKSEGAIPSNEFEDEDIQVGDEMEPSWKVRNDALIRSDRVWSLLI
ncbi:S1 RNA-binding domain-containing protein, partial [Streptococcus pneumoniae]|nr:S1 RNA-binding domain-containing protein [Streptococcus pneumoniae]